MDDTKILCIIAAIVVGIIVLKMCRDKAPKQDVTVVYHPRQNLTSSDKCLQSCHDQYNLCSSTNSNLIPSCGDKLTYCLASCPPRSS